MKIANVVLNTFRNDNRVLKISRTLGDMGHDTTVVALHDPDLPTTEERDNFKVFRVPMMTYNLPEGKAFGAIKYLEIIWRIIWKFRKYDAWHCNDIEAFLIGLFAKLTRPSLKLVYDCHEYESERNARSNFENGMVAWLERNFIKHAERVITVSPSIQNDYKIKFKLQQVDLIRNIPHAKSQAPRTRLLRDNFSIPDDHSIFLYQGALTFNRGVETIIAAFHQLAAKPVHLIFMGYGPLQKLAEEAAGTESNIHFQPAVPYDQLLSYTGSADVGLISVKPVCLSYLYCLPNKLFEYLQAGLPVLSNKLPDCAAIIDKYDVGEIVDPDEPGAWAERILHMHNEGTERYREGLLQAGEDLQWEKEEQKLIDLYTEVLS